MKNYRRRLVQVPCVVTRQVYIGTFNGTFNIARMQEKHLQQALIEANTAATKKAQARVV